jgi:hypothetical protein
MVLDSVRWIEFPYIHELPYFLALPYVVVYILPISLWFWSLYQRIRLVVFTDYIKKMVLRELRVIKEYYSLIKRVPQYAANASALQQAIADIEEYEKSISPPRFLRNLTLGSLSSLIGLAGLISTLARGTLFLPPILDLGRQAAEMITGLPPWFEMVAILGPMELLLFLIVTPIVRAVSASARYSTENFDKLRTGLRGLMIEQMSGISSSGSVALEMIPLLQEEVKHPTKLHATAQHKESDNPET